MVPYWLDFDRLQALLAGITVLGVLIALVGLALVRRPAVKVLTVVVFAILAAGAVWQLRTIDDARRRDCGSVEVLGARVLVASCPDPRA